MKLLNHVDFFYKILDKKYKFSNEKDADIFCSWKVGEQDFYIYAKKK
jgi:hypothetical protein